MGTLSGGNNQPHLCPWPGCSRSYKRLDHLERHQKIHTGELQYRCRICHKQYSRSDVLNRHLVQTHGEKPASVGRPRKAACILCVERHVSCDGIPPRVCTRCEQEDLDCRYRHLEREGRSESPSLRQSRSLSLSDTTTAFTRFTPAAHTQPHPDAQPYLGSIESGVDDHRNQFNFDVTSPLKSTFGLSTLGDAAEAMPRYEEMRVDHMEAPPLPWSDSAAIAIPESNALPLSSSTPWLTDFILSATVQDHPNNLFLSSINTAPSTSAFDWGFTDLDANINIFEPIGTHGPPSPVNDQHLGREAVVPERDEDLIVAVSAEEVDGHPNAQELPDGQPDESSWPNVYKPHTPDSSVHLPAPHQPTLFHALDLVLPPGKSVNPSARRVMQTLTLHAHRAFWPTPDLGNFPSEQTLTICVNLYLSHFAAWLPILDSPRGSFLIDKAAPILLKAVAAIGSAYGRDGIERLGLPLAELVRRELVFICEHDQRFIYELGVIQSSLLQSYFGLFSGSPKLFQQAEVNRASLVASCKRMHLLHSSVSAVTHVSRSGATADELARALKQDHRRRRLGWGIFLFDIQLACLFGLSAQYPLSEIACPLPTVAPDSSPDQIMFSQTMSSLLEMGTLPQLLDDIGYSCIAYALYRLCLDSASLQTFSHQHSSAFKYTLHFPQYKRHPQALLDQLTRHTLRSSSSPTALILSCAALAYHSHLQFTRFGFLDQVKMAAGKSGSIESRDSARVALAIWMKENPAGSRNIFANATVLRCLLSRFTNDTPPELVWTFDAALCMWACLRFSNIAEPPPSSKHKIITIAWSPSPALESWVETGDGTISVQGLGSVIGMTARSILQTSADRLEVMSWGLAARYRKVLLDLIEEE